MIEKLSAYVGQVIVAKQHGDGVEAMVGTLSSASKNWASEYVLRFIDGERVTLLEGDTVTIGSKALTLH